MGVEDKENSLSERVLSENVKILKNDVLIGITKDAPS